MDYYESKIFHYFPTFGLFSLVLVMCLWGEHCEAFKPLRRCKKGYKI